MTVTSRALTALAVAGALTLSACASDAEEPSPGDVLAAAKANLDETSGVHLSLTTEKLPKTVDGILTAEGVGTHDPAFEGDLEVSISGVTAPVPVVAAQGKVFAQLPFTQKFVEVDPADYGAPDPAALMEPEGGLSSLLTAAQEVEPGEKVRSGEDVLTTFTATVPGEAVADVIPSADPAAAFEAEFAVDDEDRLREAILTGPFYPDAEDVTYTVTFDEYDTSAEITAP